MKDSQRPVFLNLLKIRLPVTAIVSILHRASGCLLAFALPFVVFSIHYALISEANFNCMLACFHSSYLTKTAILLPALAYAYHALAGVRHMVMDCGIGLTRKGAVMTAYGLLILYGFMAIGIMGAVLWA